MSTRIRSEVRQTTRAGRVCPRSLPLPRLHGTPLQRRMLAVMGQQVLPPNIQPTRTARVPYNMRVRVAPAIHAEQSTG